MKQKAKTLGVEQFLSSKKRVMPFDGAWRAAFGQPSYSGSWIIWGASGSGKTRFALQLCKELTKYGRVAYDSLEEGDSLSLQRGFRDVNMREVSRKIVLLDRIEVPPGARQQALDIHFPCQRKGTQGQRGSVHPLRLRLQDSRRRIPGDGGQPFCRGHSGALYHLGGRSDAVLWN